jgi:hypothetical protein
MKPSLVKPDSLRPFPCCVCGEAREVGTRCPDSRCGGSATSEKETA